MPKTLKDFLEVYKPKSPDEQKFVDKHVVIKHKDRNGNGDDVFNGNTKYIKRKEERKGYDVGEDEKVYEALKGDQHKIDANKNGKVDAHDFHLLRKKKKVAEEVDEVDESYQELMALKNNIARNEKKMRAIPGIHPEKKRLAIQIEKDTKRHKALFNKQMGKNESVEDLNDLLGEALDLLDSIIEGTMPTADEPTEANKKTAQKIRDMMAKEKKPVKEEVEGLDEDLSKTSKVDLVNNYRKSKTALGRLGQTPYEDREDSGWDERVKHHKDVLDSHMAELKRREVKEEVEDLDELSTATLKSYRTKARADAYDADDVDDERRYRKRAAGSNEAGKKIIRQGGKLKEEIEELDESAKIAAHLIKRYGDNVRKSHVVSAANDFGVDASKLAKAVRTKLGKTTLAEDEQIDEISAKKLSDYMDKASDARGHRNLPTKKVDNRYAGVKKASDKLAEEEMQIDELSKKTMGSYIKKASGAEQPKNVMSPKNVPLTKIAAYQGDSETGYFGKRFNQHTYDKAERLRKNRETGITRATDKLTKEDIINRVVEKYVPEEIKFTPEERLLKRLNGLSEAHVLTLMGLFEDLNKDNQNKMIETVETSEGINQILNFVLENRGK